MNTLQAVAYPCAAVLTLIACEQQPATTQTSSPGNAAPDSVLQTDAENPLPEPNGTFEALSTFRVWRDDNGCLTTGRVDADFIVVGEVLLRQTFESVECQIYEDNPAHVMLEAWPLMGDPGAAPLFRIYVSGKPGGLVAGGWRDKLYRITQRASGGPALLDRYIGLDTLNGGKELFTSTGPVLRVRHSPRGSRIITVHENYAAYSPSEWHTDHSVAGVLMYGDGVTPSTRWVITGPSDVWYVLKDFKFVINDSVVDGNTLQLRRGGQRDSVAVTGFELALTFRHPFGRREPDLELRLPVTDDRIDVANAVMSEAVSIRLSDTQ